MIRAWRGVSPKIAASAYVDPSAQVLGDVTIGERSSVWMNATLRGDVNWIRIGEESNVQDNCVLHVDAPDYPMVLGNRVTIGHSVVLHGCTVDDGCVVGIGAVVLNGARIGANSVIASGAVVTEGMQVPSGSMVMGVPAKVKRDVTDAERERFRVNAGHYVELAALYRNGAA